VKISKHLSVAHSFLLQIWAHFIVQLELSVFKRVTFDNFCRCLLKTMIFTEEVLRIFCILEKVMSFVASVSRLLPWVVWLNVDVSIDQLLPWLDIVLAVLVRRSLMCWSAPLFVDKVRLEDANFFFSWLLHSTSKLFIVILSIFRLVDCISVLFVCNERVVVDSIRL